MNAALLSLIGLVIGASLQYLFTRHIENQRHIRDLRSQAYMDILKSVCEYGNSNPTRESKEGIALAERTAHAKSRICLYGSREVIEAYSKWQQVGPSMNTKEQCEAFILLVKAMRKDSGGEFDVALQDIQNVLLGVR